MTRQKFIRVFSVIILIFAIRGNEAIAGKSIENGLIAFSSNRTGSLEIYTMKPDGSDEHQLTFENGSGPVWSPDGTKITFTSVRTGDFEVYLMDADGSNQVNITNKPESDESVSDWSPDGSQILFTTRYLVGTDIFVMNADGSNQQNLTNQNGEYDNFMPSWSPDGSEIFFASNRKYGPQPATEPPIRSFFIMNPDGSDVTDFNMSDPYLGFPDWSPDGELIVFQGGCDGEECEIGTVTSDEVNVTWLTFPNDIQESDPSWSPDGQKIIFTSKENGETFDIMVMDADGSNRINLTNAVHLADYRSPSWQSVVADD